MSISPNDLSAHLLKFFGLDDSHAQIDDLAARIQFHRKYLKQSEFDDLSTLIFIDAGEHQREHGSLSIEDLHHILSRVQKRIYRKNRMASGILPIDESQLTAPEDSESGFQDLIKEIKSVLSLEDFALFYAYFVQQDSLSRIAKSLQTNKTKVHRELKRIQRDLRAVVD